MAQILFPDTAQPEPASLPPEINDSSKDVGDDIEAAEAAAQGKNSVDTISDKEYTLPARDLPAPAPKLTPAPLSADNDDSSDFFEDEIAEAAAEGDN